MDHFLYDSELLIHAFIHHQEKELDFSMPIPLGIMQMVTEFYDRLFPKLLKFDLFSDTIFSLPDEDGYEIQGRGGNCSGYLIYPEAIHPDGYSRGIHFWSVKLLGCPKEDRYCFHSIGVISKEERDKKVDQNSLETVYDEWPSKWKTKSGSDYHPGDDWNHYWGRDDTMTVRLNCNNGEVKYWKNDKVIRSGTVDNEKSYFFVMTSCALTDNKFRVLLDRNDRNRRTKRQCYDSFLPMFLAIDHIFYPAM